MSLMLVHFMRKCCSGKTKWHDWTVIVCKYRQTDPWREKIPAISSPTVHANFFSHSKSNFTRFEGWRKLKCFNLCNLCILHRQSIAFASYANVRLMGWWIELLQLDSAKELFLHLTSWIREARKNLFGFHLARENRGNMMQNLWRNKTWSHKRASKREWISDFY